MILQITRSCTLVSGSTHDLECARAEFDRKHCLLFPQLLEPDLLQYVRSRLDHGAFCEKTSHGVGTELCLRPDETTGVMEFLTNDPRLLQAMEQITGCGRIGCFKGRVYRMLSGNHYDSWHDDMVHGRLMAMSINLSTEVYGGGVLQIRDCRSGEVVHEVANVGFGDAILFRIAPYLQHQVTSVEGPAAKTAYAGWFFSQPDYVSLLREEVGRSQPGVAPVNAADPA